MSMGPAYPLAQPLAPGPWECEVASQRILIADDESDIRDVLRTTLDWSRQQRSASPLTGLPGNHSINAEIRSRLGESRPFALMQIDVDHFKAFNDYYGYGRGDEAIQLLARILTESVHRVCGAAGFVGHIGGDDFVVLCPCDQAAGLGEEILAWFNTAAAQLYDAEDRE